METQLLNVLTTLASSYCIRSVSVENTVRPSLFSPHLLFQSSRYDDHVVGNQGNDEMVPVTDWYQKMLQFHKF